MNSVNWLVFLMDSSVFSVMEEIYFESEAVPTHCKGPT
jgi:hypothetical protein